MTRPTPAELARYRRDIPSLKWVSRGIGEQLLAEIAAVEAELAAVKANEARAIAWGEHWKEAAILLFKDEHVEEDAPSFASEVEEAFAEKYAAQAKEGE
jgi:hypothetical protein